MKYIKRYNNFEEFASAETVTLTEEYVSSIEPGLAGIRSDLNAAWYNQIPSNRRMTVEELIAAGYAEIIQDRSVIAPGYETGSSVVQIHSNCPIRLENITNFDTWLTSATTFVWREALPAGWNPVALAEKYSGTSLARSIMVEMFSAVDMSGVDNLHLSFAGAEWAWPQSSILSQRYRSHEQGGNTATFLTPKHVIVDIRGVYTSVAQTTFSMFRTTSALTINCGGVFSCHDVTGLFEGNPNLEVLEINGPFRWDGMMTCHLLFDQDDKLTSVPYVVDWGRDDEASASYNTIYPRTVGDRGTANCGGIFNATGLTFIGPRLNMNAVSLCGCTVDGYNQVPIPYAYKGVFNCPNCTDVRIINLNNNDWNFADNSTWTYLPSINVTSIEYILNHVADCSSNPHTVTFKNTYQNQVSSAAISAAAAKGWTVAWQS